MKRIFILITGMLLLGAVAWGEETTMIDFGQLVPDSDDFPGEHEQTLVDYSDVPIPGLSEEDQEELRTSLAIENWQVRLNSSANSVANRTSSFVQLAEVNDDAERFAGEAVLGARVRFPESAYNAYATIRPPFEIPGFDEERRFDGYGVVRNIGAIRQIRVNMYGLNFPHRLSIMLVDENNNRQEIMLGNLEFDGWNTLVWDNPNYVEDVRDRELEVMPRYPFSEPIQKLDGLRVYRDSEQVGGDFVTYVKDVNIVYDLAQPDSEPDISHEEVWGILEERERQRRQTELSRVGRVQALRALEEELMDEELNGPQGGE
ncbi:MAG: flagellar filament outer layer protein FlaA [Spirochaetales bacterium]